MNSYWLSRTVILILLLVGQLSAEEVAWPALVTKTGKTFFNARVNAKEETGIVILHQGGISRVNYLDLPEEDQRRFIFDRAKAEPVFQEILRVSEEDKRKMQEARQRQEKAEEWAAQQREHAKFIEDLASATEVKHDRFTGQMTIVSAQKLAMPKPLHMSILCREVEGKPVFDLRFINISDQWLWITERDVLVLIDGNLQKCEVSHKSGILNPGHFEMLSATLSLEQAEAFCDAKEIAVKVAWQEIDLNSSHQLALGFVKYRYLHEKIAGKRKANGK